MNIFYFSSDLFAGVMSVSMVSLLENNKASPDIHLYVADDGISDSKKHRLSEMVKGYHREIDFIPAPDPSEIFAYPLKSRYQLGHSYMRMCPGSILPKSLDRVICLDSDTLIRGDISELWSTPDTKAGILYGVSDCFNLEAFKGRFGIPSDGICCNAGVFVIDLKRWRAEGIESKIRDIIRAQNGNVFFSEQTLMSRVCQGEIAKLPLKYNAQSIIFAFSYDDILTFRRPTRYYSEHEVNEAKSAPVIIHFTRNFYMQCRPWAAGCEHPFLDEWLRYKSMTPFNDEPLVEMSTKEKLKRRIFRTIPRKIFMPAIGMIYNDIRPKLLWLNE